MLPERAPDALPTPPPSPARAGHVTRLHASCVAIDGAGVLLLGRPGAGKSDLALRLIDHGATLIADDQVLVERRGDDLIARSPAPLRGLLEVRGIGILRLPSGPAVRLTLAVELLRDERRERLPDGRSHTLLGRSLRLLRLDPFAASAPAALRLALRAERVA